jgi:hypothetical protein
MVKPRPPLALLLLSIATGSQASWLLTFSEEFDGDRISSNWSVPNGGVHGANELELHVDQPPPIAAISLPSLPLVAAS